MPMMLTTTTARRDFPMDIPPTILDAIRSAPSHEPHWLTLAKHYHDKGNDDLVLVVRHHWQCLRDTVANGMPPEQVIAEMSDWLVRQLAQDARKAVPTPKSRPPNSPPQG